MGYARPSNVLIKLEGLLLYCMKWFLLPVPQKINSRAFSPGPGCFVIVGLKFAYQLLSAAFYVFRKKKKDERKSKPLQRSHLPDLMYYVSL